MTGAAFQAMYLLVAAVLAPPLLARARWPIRAPRLAIGLWLGMVVSALASFVFLGLELAGTAVHALIWQCCVRWVAHLSPDSLRVLTTVAGAAIAVGVPLRVSTVLLRNHLRWRRRQQNHVAAVDLLGHRVGLRDTSAVAIDHACPAAYCVAAHGGRIVLTTAALKMLSRAELAAVMEHERAHLRGRHHYIMCFTGSVAHAMAWVPLFAEAKGAVARLVEMAADDAAARQVRADVLARGLARLAAGRVENAPVAGAGALHASGGDVAERINRLLDSGTAYGSKSAYGAGACWMLGLVATPSAVCVATVSLWC
ncbi:M56 family metallopeptidase [Streptomyces sp. LHD-70]|uniref:M56 family metallopeptidase n=1 Tax=Streptomyces sp. LHD-70 TaxID=3072140 RepID=UPI00280D4162|nr:M56 family metallopeptidase [Streptomyces sp. LHD-70]MDQ8706511.1 M56 family metallopeptidase [Streptomyces sp. LHD-70]